ncbi:MAG: cell division protein ZapA [Chitinophagaceae bacterium]|jgi:cell division protein ZapA
MQNEELTPVNLWLAGRSYRILVKKNEVDSIRKAVKVADEKIAELKQTYSGKDDQDFLAMCLLMYASDSNGNDSLSIADDLKKINEEIDKALE